MAYVYRHIRHDKNEPFYIGIGSDKDYKRAYNDKKRNNLWHKIQSITTYDVEILIDNLTWDEACNKEKEFIKLYGKKCNNSGTLSNLTDGGEGVLGLVFNLESKNKMSISQRNKKPISEETRERMRKASQSRDCVAHLRGKKQTEETKEKRRISLTGKKKKQTTCPYCKFVGGGGAMKQWHFENCKYKFYAIN